MDEPSDAELLRSHVAGDPDAFGRLFLRHSGRLWAVALRTTGDPDDAADALQEAMISAFRRAGDFRGQSAVTTWLHRIVVNASVDRIRRRPSRSVAWSGDEDALEALAARGTRGAGGGSARGGWSREGSSADGGSGTGEGGDSGGGTGAAGGISAAGIAAANGASAGPGGTSGAESAEAIETRLDVDAALRVLPPEQRAALVLVDMLGYPVADVAEILGISAGTVKSRCARGRAKLVPYLAHLRTKAVGPKSGGPKSGDPGNHTGGGSVSSEQEGGA